MADHSIALIDVSCCSLGGEGASEALLRQVESACRDVGFMYVTGHGIGTLVREGIRAAVISYFDRPLEDKLHERISRDNYRGYIPAGFFSPNSGVGEADTYEGYKLHTETPSSDPICQLCDLYGPNKWPHTPPLFRQAVLEYWQACDRLAAILLELLAKILGVVPADFLQLFESPLTNMSLLHYPAALPGQPGYGIHAHKDTDALTILAPDPVGGLQLRRRGCDEWIDVAAPENALVVNIGDLLELWSGGYFVSTPHRVLNPTGAERYSYPYFVVPRYDVVVEPLLRRMKGFERGSVHVGDVSREVWRTNWPDTAPHSTGYDLGTLED
jgi:isopenicillin N synthase-like dioxygenase